MRRFYVSRARLALGIVAAGGVGLTSGGIATAVATSGSQSLPRQLATLVAKHPRPMRVIGQQGIPLVKVNPNGTLDPSVTSPAHCHFAPSTKKGATPGTITDAHPSTSVRGAIKVNSYIVCDHAVQALSNRTQLWKTGLLVNHLQSNHPPTTNTGRAVLANQDAWRRCTNTKSTTWYGVAYGVSEEGGQLYYGSGASPHKRTFNCGT